MNAHVVSTLMTSFDEAAGTSMFSLATTLQYPFMSVPAVVDVSGMEFALVNMQEAATGIGQSVASGASTVEFQFGDMGGTATGAASGNHLINPDDLSNTLAGGWTLHEARFAVGTSNTDLDADDWVGLHSVANLTTTAGIGSATIRAHFVYGKPGSIN